MGGQVVISTNEAPLFDGTDYSSWRKNMKRYLKSRGSRVLDLVVCNPSHLNTSKRKNKTTKEARNNSLSLKEIQDGLSDQVKENMGHHIYAKVIWIQLDNSYQNKEKNKEMDNSNQFIEPKKETEKSNQIKEQNS